MVLVTCPSSNHADEPDLGYVALNQGTESREDSAQQKQETGRLDVSIKWGCCLPPTRVIVRYE